LQRYLIVGQVGVGKSSFINAVFGVEVAKPNPFEAETKTVESFTYTTPDGDIELIDTPGLGESTIEQDKIYLSVVSVAIVRQPIDVLIYVTRLDYTRFSSSEKQTLQLITQQLGFHVWKKSWLVFTRAAAIPRERFDKTVNARASDICLYLQDSTMSLDMGNSQFKQFQSVMVIDNLTPGWHSNAVPVTSIFKH